MRLNLSSSQLARISLAEFVSKLILIELDFDCEPGPGQYMRTCISQLTHVTGATGFVSGEEVSLHVR